MKLVAVGMAVAMVGTMSTNVFAGELIRDKGYDLEILGIDEFTLAEMPSEKRQIYNDVVIKIWH